ncbi:TINAG protein, partial [Polypterus senegalus]|nr:TINAG protein [Polypterus senegalus]
MLDEKTEEDPSGQVNSEDDSQLDPHAENFTILSGTAGRETKYTKPGVIRPVSVTPRITEEKDVVHPNPFRRYLEDTSDADLQQLVSRVRGLSTRLGMDNTRDSKLQRLRREGDSKRLHAQLHITEGEEQTAKKITSGSPSLFLFLIKDERDFILLRAKGDTTGGVNTCRQSLWECSEFVCLIRQELIDSINGHQVGWTAGNYSQFWGMTLEEGIKHRLGTAEPSPSILEMTEMKVKADLSNGLPEFFTASYKWSNWIHGPLDQGNCAASWAFSTASVAADRIAIHSQGRRTANLSPQNLISCNTKDQNGCHGGNVANAWWYLRKNGLVSTECYPFTNGRSFESSCMMSSEKSNERGKRHAVTPCPSSALHSNEIHLCTPAYRISSNIAANSWGTWWGEDGYFRILRGVNECDIEMLIIGAWGYVDMLDYPPHEDYDA